MSIKNIVNAQVAKVTQYSPTTGLVNGLATSGNITAQTGAFFLGDGGLLSNIATPYGNTDVALYLPTYTGNLGNVDSITASGNLSVTSNVTANLLSLGTGNLQLTGNIISSTADTITIDPLGDGTGAGNLVVQGNMQVSGNITYNDIVNATTNDLQWIAANNAINPAAASGGGLSVGPSGAYASFTYNSASSVWQSSLPLLANGGVNANGALSGATTGSFSGNVTADYFIGNGSQLTDLSATNINTGTLAQARLANSTMTVNGTTLTLGGTSTITANAETLTGTSLSATVVGSSLTSVGTLTSLAVTGNITGGNITTSGVVSATGNITGDYFIGNGSQLTGLPAGYSNANVASYLPTYTGNLDNVDSITASGNIIGANVGNSTTILQGDGGLISNISVAAGTQIVSGTTSVAIDGVDGNIDFTVAGDLFGTISTNQVAIGNQAGVTGSANSIAIGTYAGYFALANTITIGAGAGQGHPIGSELGANSIAIGVNASRGGLGVALPGNTIVLNATGANLNPPQANSFFVAPVRNDTGNTTNVVYYNTTTKEVTYGPGVVAYSNANVASYLPTYTGSMGNVASITASGDITANSYIGDGSQLTGLYANANVASYLPTYTGNLGNVDIISATGIIATDSADLGAVGNITITGGNSGEVLTTDGSGNLSWAEVGLFSVPPVYITAVLSGNNQTFSNTILASYNSNTDMTVFYNGALLENTYYTLSGDTITVNIPLAIGDGIDVVTTIASNVNSIVSSGYGNSNVAAYLPLYTGNLANLAGNVTTTGNVNAAKVSLGTGNLQLTGNIISSTADTITIDPLGDGTGAGNVVVQGNMQIAGTLTYNNIVNATTNDLQWIAANNAASAAAASGGGLSVGPAGAYAAFTYNAGSNVWQSSLPLVANGGVNANGALSGATTGSFSGNVTASYFIGNGSSLSQLTGANVTGTVASATVAASANSVAGANVSGQVANALVAGTVYTSAQPNITSVGTLTSLAVTGNITGGNITTGGVVSATGNITGGNITTSGVVSATGNITGSNINTSGNINFSVAEGNSDSARIFANVASNITSLIMEVSDDIEDKIVLRHKYYATGNTVDMFTAQLANNTQANITVTGNLIATDRVTATNIGNVAAINLNGNSSFYLSGAGTWGIPGPESVTSTILFSASGSAPTKATTRQADWITLQDDKSGWCTVQFQYVATNQSGAAAGSGIYYISLPSGYRFDTAFHRTDNTTVTQANSQMITKVIPGSTGFISWGTDVPNSTGLPVASTLAVIPVSDTSFKLVTPVIIQPSGTPIGASNWTIVNSGYYALNGVANYVMSASFRFKKSS
jgi:hypothetical protein